MKCDKHFVTYGPLGNCLQCTIDELMVIVKAAKREAVKHLNDQNSDTTCAFNRCELCKTVANYERIHGGI